MPAHRDATPRRTSRPAPPPPALKAAPAPVSRAKKEGPRFPMSLQVLPEAFAVTGELGLTGASYAAWWPPEAEQVKVKAEFFGVKYELGAKVAKVEQSGRSLKVHLAFEALPEETEQAVLRWVENEARKRS